MTEEEFQKELGRWHKTLEDFGEGKVTKEDYLVAEGRYMKALAERPGTQQLNG